MQLSLWTVCACRRDAPAGGAIGQLSEMKSWSHEFSGGARAQGADCHHDIFQRSNLEGHHHVRTSTISEAGSAADTAAKHPGGSSQHDAPNRFERSVTYLRMGTGATTIVGEGVTGQRSDTADAAMELGGRPVGVQSSVTERQRDITDTT